jgi:hypothetical protein
MIGVNLTDELDGVERLFAAWVGFIVRTIIPPRSLPL